LKKPKGLFDIKPNKNRGVFVKGHKLKESENWPKSIKINSLGKVFDVDRLPPVHRGG